MSGRTSYYIDIRHEELNKYRRVKGSDSYVVEQQAEAQMQQWEELWERKLEAQRKKEERETIAQDRDGKKKLAIEKTEEALADIEKIKNTLKHTLSIDDTIDWVSLIDKRQFPKKVPSKPTYNTIPSEPDVYDNRYKPKIGLVGFIFPSIKRKRIEYAQIAFQNDITIWEKEKSKLIDENECRERKYNDDCTLWEKE